MQKSRSYTVCNVIFNENIVTSYEVRVCMSVVHFNLFWGSKTRRKIRGKSSYAFYRVMYSKLVKDEERFRRNSVSNANDEGFL